MVIEFLKNVLKRILMSKTLGGLLEILLNPNPIDLDLYYPIGWSNSQTHILYKLSCYFNPFWANTN